MNKTRSFFLFLITIGVIFSATVNVVRQFSILNGAKKMNIDLSKKIDELKKTNIELSNKIVYATSSAYLEEAAMEKFGLGTENDLWLELPPEPEKEAKISVDLDQIKPKYQQWFDLFTK
jgi:hypothetical protein